MDSPDHMNFSQMQIVNEDGMDNNVSDESRDGEKPCAMEQHSSSPCLDEHSDGSESGLHVAGDTGPPEGRPNSEPVLLNVQGSPDGGSGKVLLHCKVPCKQKEVDGRQPVSIVESQPHLTGSAHGDRSSSESLPSPASSQSSYVSFGLMIDESDGDDMNNETKHEEKKGQDVEGAQKAVKMSKGKEIATATAMNKSTSPPTSQTMQVVSNLPWVKDSGVPPPKLPIRFIDCIGRHYIFPWTKARKWKGMKELIRSAFINIDNLGPHVIAGHYDLIIQDVWVDPIAAAIKSTLANHPSHFDPLETAISSFTIGESSSNIITPTSPPSHLLPKPCKGATILPELWDDIIEPGMMVKMAAWPGIGRNIPPPQQQQHSQSAPSFSWPRRGGPPPPIVTPPPPPPGKTRKRQDGL